MCADRLAPDCNCGCVPNVMGLHEAARERGRRREAAAAAASRPTVAEYLAEHGAPRLPGPAEKAAILTAIAMECEESEEG